MKILILGHARHGKTTVADILQTELRLKYWDSSAAALQIFLYKRLQELGYSYPDAQICYQCRTSDHMRKIWHEEIKAYNTPDKARLAREILHKADMYVGMRCPEELAACRGENLFNLYLWVHREGTPLEPIDSMKIEFDKSYMIPISNAKNLFILKNTVVKRVQALANARGLTYGP